MDSTAPAPGPRVSQSHSNVQHKGAKGQRRQRVRQMGLLVVSCLVRFRYHVRKDEPLTIFVAFVPLLLCVEIGYRTTVTCATTAPECIVEVGICSTEGSAMKRVSILLALAA